MKARSIYVNTIPTPVQIVASKIQNLYARKKNKSLVTIVTQRHLKRLSELVRTGLGIGVHKTFALEEVVEAYAQAESGGIVGKMVFEI